MSVRRSRQTTVALSAFLLFLAVSTPAPRAEGLTDAEFTGYLAWLKSLAGYVPTEGDHAVAPRLYPFDLAGDDDLGFAVVVSSAGGAEHGGPGDEQPDADVLIVANRGLIDLERELRRPSARRGISVQDALRAARQYRHAAEYDSALAWYGRAEALDATGELQRQIARESIATAVALGDSAAVARRVLRCLAGEPSEEETIIALRYLIAHRDEANLTRLVGAAETRDPQAQLLAVWLAYAHSARGDWPACLAGLCALLARGGPEADVSAPLRAWVLVSVPDMLFLAGDRDGAAALYRALAASEIPGVATWARLQVACLDLLGDRRGAAINALTTLCADEATEPWRAYACEMAKHGGNLGYPATAASICEQLLAEIEAQSAGATGQEQFALQLEPASLGTVHVRLQATGSRLAIVVQTQSAEAENALSQGAHDIVEAVVDHGAGRWQQAELLFDQPTTKSGQHAGRDDLGDASGQRRGNQQGRRRIERADD